MIRGTLARLKKIQILVSSITSAVMLFDEAF